MYYYSTIDNTSILSPKGKLSIVFNMPMSRDDFGFNYEIDPYDASDNDADHMSMDDSVVTMNTATTSVRKSQKKALEDSKKQDKGYYVLKKVENGRSMKIEMYNSGYVIGKKARDPIYGTRMPLKIGSENEYAYFKVRVCGLDSINPVTLYYDSPDHFERHFKTKLSNATKQKWNKDHGISFNNNDFDNVSQTM